MNRWPLRLAAHVLKRGGVIAYPTEAVFGLGCDPWNWLAMDRLLSLKRRPIEKGVILIAAHVEQLAPLVEWSRVDDKKTVLATWPGPVTWLLPARAGVPDWVTGGTHTVGVRISAHPQCVALCEHYGAALVSTSANISGRAPARTVLQVRGQFGSALDYTLAGSVGGEAGPSEIRDARTGLVKRARVASRAAASGGGF